MVPPIIIAVGGAIESTSVIIGLFLGIVIGTLSISSFGLIGYMLTDHLLTGDGVDKYFRDEIPKRRLGREPPGGYVTFGPTAPMVRLVRDPLQ